MSAVLQKKTPGKILRKFSWKVSWKVLRKFTEDSGHSGKIPRKPLRKFTGASK